MVRRDDCLVQLNDAEEAEQRALEGRPDGATRCWSSAAPAAPTPNFEGEDVPAREHETCHNHSHNHVSTQVS